MRLTLSFLLIQKYFVLFVVMNSIIVLLTQNTFANPNCPNALLRESQVENSETNITFQESISILSDAEKLKILSDLNIDESKKDMIIRVGIIRDIQTQNKILRDVIGLDHHTIDTLRNKGVLQIHPIEYQKFTTVPPVNPTHIQPRAIISAINKNGYLENVIIEKIEGENIYIRFKEKEGFKVIPRKEAYQPILKVISRKEAYQPILRERQVYYLDENGIPNRQSISYIDPHNINQHYLSRLDDKTTQEYSYIDTLDLRPRKEMVTSKEDYSKRITFKSLISLWRHYRKLIRHYKRHGINEDVIKLNNDFLNRLSIEMRKAGIVTRLLPSNINFENDNAIYDPLIMNLSIDGVHENGNRLMRRYLKTAERLNIPSIEISPLIEVKEKSRGRLHRETNTLKLNVNSAIDILSKNNDDETIPHELSHTMFNSKSIAKSGFNIYNTTFEATGETRLNNYGLYDKFLSLSELYTYTSSLLLLSKKLLKSQSIAERVRKFLNPFILFKQTNKLSQIKDMFRTLKILNKTVQEFFNNLEKGLTIVPSEGIKEDSIRYVDNKGRVVVIEIRGEINKILDSQLSFFFQHEITHLIEEIQKYMTSLAAPDIHLARNYIEFLQDDPTVMEFLEKKEHFGYDYESDLQERYSLHLRNVIESKIVDIEEKVVQLAAQEIERRLDQIKTLTLKASYQLDIIEYYLKSSGLRKALKINKRDDLKKLTREIKKLQLILHKEI